MSFPVPTVVKCPRSSEACLMQKKLWKISFGRRRLGIIKEQNQNLKPRPRRRSHSAKGIKASRFEKGLQEKKRVYRIRKHSLDNQEKILPLRNAVIILELFPYALHPPNQLCSRINICLRTGRACIWREAKTINPLREVLQLQTDQQNKLKQNRKLK